MKDKELWNITDSGWTYLDKLNDGVVDKVREGLDHVAPGVYEVCKIENESSFRRPGIYIRRRGAKR